MSILPIQDTIRLTLAEESPMPVCAYLFGSRGREDSRPDSEVKARREYFDVLPYLRKYRDKTGKRSA